MPAPFNGDVSGILGRPVKPGDDSNIWSKARFLLPRLQLARQREQFGRG
jgi:hypothetical protein